MKQTILLISLLFFSNSWAEEESLDIEFFQGDPNQVSECLSEMTGYKCVFRTYQSCNFLLGVMHETWKSRDNYDALFPNGELPECINNELPDAWVENRTPINRYGQTVCKIPCNVRSLPMLSNSIAGIGHIIGSKKILILELVEVNDNVNNYHTTTPWYNYWHSFIHEGKKLYIHTDNVMLSDEVPSYRLIKHGGISYEVDSKLEIRNHLYYEITTQEPFTGRTVGKNYRGWKEVINYKNGKRHGLNEWFYNTDQSFFRTHFKNGKLDGLSEMFHENGEIYSSSPTCYKEGVETDMSYCNN